MAVWIELFSVVAALSKSIKELQKVSVYAFPLSVHYLASDQFVTQFHELLIDDNIDPQQSYTCFESQIVDKVVQTVMSLYPFC